MTIKLEPMNRVIIHYVDENHNFKKKDFWYPADQETSFNVPLNTFSSEIYLYGRDQE